MNTKTASILFAIALTGSGCASFDASRSHVSGVDENIMVNASHVNIGDSVERLKELGIDSQAMGIDLVLFSNIPEKIIGSVPSSYEDLLSDEVLTCLRKKEKCYALSVERETMKLKDNPDIESFFGVDENFEGSKTSQKYLFVILDETVVYIHDGSKPETPVQEREKDPLAPVKFSPLKLLFMAF